jgi:hypothetical protein
MELKFSSFENFYAHIRTHDGAHRAPRTFALRVVENHVLITLVINGFFLAHQLVGTYFNTQDTSLTFIFVDFYCRHG